MSQLGVLAGKSIAVTRPAAQAGELAQLIRSAGATPQLLPLLDIAAALDPSPLQHALATLDQAVLAIFISPNAVSYSLPALLAAGPWPHGLRIAAIGPGTVRALQAYGLHDCLVPTQGFDSEALLALPELQAERIAGQRVLIFRGDGGRELLAASLTARGALVEAVPCYRRSPPAQGFTLWSKLLASRALDAVTVSSSEGLRHLCAALAPPALTQLAALPLFVPHQRIAESAKTCGMRQIILTEPADAGIFAALCAYNWSRS